jgi:hypothetical protein
MDLRPAWPEMGFGSDSSGGIRYQFRHWIVGPVRIENHAFIYSDRETGRVATIFAYPTNKIAEAGQSEISNLFG